jgi:hypothetical protein
MTLRRTLPATAACIALFGAAFVAGNALLDDEDSPRARPTRDAPPADSGQPAVPRQLALALGRAAGLPGLRTSAPPARKPPAKKSPAQAGGSPARAGGSPAESAAAAPPTSGTTPAPNPVVETQPVDTPAPTPPTPPSPTTPSPPTSSAPRPDAAPRPPQPIADPAPSGGASYEPDEK